MLLNFSTWCALAALPTMLSCALGAGATDGGPPSSSRGETEDGGAGVIDAGRMHCGAGRHMCGAGCIDDLDNLPQNGCRLGCGDPCPAPPGGAASCDDRGACSFACAPPFREVDGSCVCTPHTCADLGAMCGDPDDGCGTPLACGRCPGGGVCNDGACGCPPDEREPNESRLTAPVIGAADDASDTHLAFESFSIHGPSDEDWFEVSVRDGFDFGNPRIRVSLRGIPSGDDYDLAAYFLCDSGGDDSACHVGVTDDMVGRGCASRTRGSGPEAIDLEAECTGLDESGRLLLQIQAHTFSGMCAAYELEIDVI